LAPGRGIRRRRRVNAYPTGFDPRYFGAPRLTSLAALSSRSPANFGCRITWSLSSSNRRFRPPVGGTPMRWTTLVFAHVVAFSTLGFADTLTDSQVRQIMIKQSIASYPGNCPCPHNLASNGSQCGKRSAYSKPGGYTPLCSPSDISDEAVKAWRAQHGEGQ